MSKDDTDYTDEFVEGLELSWGEGFLSPGGSDEVARVVKNIDVRGKRVLDIGSGLGGPAICLVSKHFAAEVVGVDIEALNVERATRNAAKAGVSDRVKFMTVEAGSLPFDDHSFDLVFSKDAITEAPDKEAVFSEAVRVLRPQGWLALSDWFRGSDDYTPEMLAWMEGAGVTLEFVTLDETADLLRAAGLTDVETEDRNAWYQECVKDEVARMAGPDRHLFEALLGKEDADVWIAASERRSVVVAQGQLRPGHLRAQKP